MLELGFGFELVLEGRNGEGVVVWCLGVGAWIGGSMTNPLSLARNLSKSPI